MTEIRYVDPDGNPISAEEWSARRNDVEGCTVAVDVVGEVTIRTVWLGDNSPEFGMYPFGTAVAEPATKGKFWERRTYPTKEDALDGHEYIVAKYQGKMTP